MYRSFETNVNKLFNCFLFIIGEKCDCPSAIIWYYWGLFLIIENILLYNREQGNYVEHLKQGTVLGILTQILCTNIMYKYYVQSWKI